MHVLEIAGKILRQASKDSAASKESGDRLMLLIKLSPNFENSQSRSSVSVANEQINSLMEK